MDKEYIIKKFKDYLKKKGLKYTQEREDILKEILSIGDHFDVESLYFRFKNKNSKISKASIYRTLPLLIEGGYIQEVYKQEGHSHYEVTINKKPHLHFICIHCGEVLEVMDDVLIRLIKKHEKQKNYKLLTYHLEIFGLCPTCKEGY
ncbi:MAG: Fur family transcriptional regulator [Caldimicrobium sp.]